MSTEERPKIIVDDDWKTRVQAEKELARPPAVEEAPSSEEATPSETKPEELPLPPPTFESLVSMLATQALAGLGQIPLGEDQKPVLMLDHAKHYIDLLGMLEEKTKGNLAKHEADMLTNIVHELRMVFVAMKARA